MPFLSDGFATMEPSAPPLLHGGRPQSAENNTIFAVFMRIESVSRRLSALDSFTEPDIRADVLFPEPGLHTEASAGAGLLRMQKKEEKKQPDRGRIGDAAGRS